MSAGVPQVQQLQLFLLSTLPRRLNLPTLLLPRPKPFEAGDVGRAQQVQQQHLLLLSALLFLVLLLRSILLNPILLASQDPSR